MTTREKKILKGILQYLHDADHGQRTEIQIHAGAFPSFDDTPPSVDELRVCIRMANAGGMIRGVPSRFAGMKWNITDVGESAWMELCE